MRIGILTQPLVNNYGGLIQAYALKTVLQNLGNEVCIINRTGYLRRNQIIWRKFLSSCKKFKESFLRNNISDNTKSIINSNCTRFINNYIIDVSKDLSTLDEFTQYIKTKRFDAYVVGSDQVWRPIYSPCIENYYLDFCLNDDVKKIAYAASFGVDEWEYTNKETRICSDLAKRFTAISVREESAIRLCKKHLGVNAIHVLDPTLLLDIEEYTKIVISENESKSSGTLFYYLLDETEEKLNLINYIENKLNLKSFKCLPNKKITIEGNVDNIEDYVYPSPTKWIRSFMDAEMVLTDSFHGTVFSIIFNKPFWVLHNAHRGNTRFDSLLKIFGLQDRLINISEYNKHDYSKPIDWNRVNNIKKQKREESIDFIKNALI